MRVDADSGCLSRPPLLVRLPGRLLVRGSGLPGLHLRGLRHGPGPGEVHGDDDDDDDDYDGMMMMARRRPGMWLTTTVVSTKV